MDSPVAVEIPITARPEASAAFALPLGTPASTAVPSAPSIRPRSSPPVRLPAPLVRPPSSPPLTTPSNQAAARSVEILITPMAPLLDVECAPAPMRSDVESMSGELVVPASLREHAPPHRVASPHRPVLRSAHARLPRVRGQPVALVGLCLLVIAVLTAVALVAAV